MLYLYIIKTGTRKNILSAIIVLVSLGVFWVITSFLLTVFDTRIPHEVENNAADWPLPNQNYASTREAQGSTIDSSNVTALGVGWSVPFIGISEWGAAATNPLVIGHTVYVQDLKSNVYAINFTTGKTLWTKEYDLDIAGPSGVAVGYNKVFAVKGHYSVAALSLSGEELWSTKLSDDENVGIDIQPIVYDNRIYVSTVPGVSNENFYKGGSTGILYALDAKTGKIVWQFNTVDSEDIWGNPKENSGGGAWYPPSINTKTGEMYWGIGNPAPWPGTKSFPNGSSRPGPNLYTNSVVNISSKTGALNWYKQLLPHDLFDYDLQSTPILATTKQNGITRNVAFASGKMGKVYAIDTDTKSLLWEASVGTHKNDELTELPAGETEVSPGPLGGIETPLAYSNNVLYVPVVNMTVKYTPSEFVVSSFDLSKATGELYAINATTGSVVWKKEFPSMNVGAATVVNDLVFTSTLDGRIYAFNKEDGTLLFEYQAPGGVNGWPAVKGDTIIFPVGLGENPVLLALRLGGKAEVVPTTEIPNAPIGGGKGFQQ